MDKATEEQSKASLFIVGRLLHPPECPFDFLNYEAHNSNSAPKGHKARYPRDTFHDAYIFPVDSERNDLTGGRWINLRQQETTKQHVARLRLLDITCPATALSICDPNIDTPANFPVIFLTSQLLCFLGSTPGKDIVEVRHCPTRPPLASRINIRMVGETGHHKSHYLGQLHQYFAVPRVLSEGEVFSVFSETSTLASLWMVETHRQYCLSKLLGAESNKNLVRKISFSSFEDSYSKKNPEADEARRMASPDTNRCGCCCISYERLMCLAECGRLWRPLSLTELGLDKIPTLEKTESGNQEGKHVTAWSAGAFREIEKKNGADPEPGEKEPQLCLSDFVSSSVGNLFSPLTHEPSELSELWKIADHAVDDDNIQVRPGAIVRPVDAVEGLASYQLPFFVVESLLPISSTASCTSKIVDLKSTALILSQVPNFISSPISLQGEHLLRVVPRPLPSAMSNNNWFLKLSRLVRLVTRVSESTVKLSRALYVTEVEESDALSVLRLLGYRLGITVVDINAYSLIFPSNASPSTPADISPALFAPLEALLDVFRTIWKRPAILVLTRLQSVLELSNFSSVNSSIARRIAASIKKFTSDKIYSGSQVALVCLGTSYDALPEDITDALTQEYPLPSLNDHTRKEIIKRLLVGRPESIDLELEEIEHIVTHIERIATGLKVTQLYYICKELVIYPMPSAEVLKKDLQSLLKEMCAIESSVLSTTTIPDVRWDDLGGMEAAKKELYDLISIPISHSGVFSGKLRSGLLLYGPPGTGKTLLAKAVANECGVNFLSIKGPELLNMYIGESERNVREVFARAKDASPCVIFFDELDSLAPARGRGADSGGVMDRVVAQLLTEMDTLPRNIFIIGATNRPDLLDQSLLRPGRLDRMVYLGIVEDKLPLLIAITRKFRISYTKLENEKEPNVLQRVAKRLPRTFTGADCKALCTEALLKAMKERANNFLQMSETLDITVSTLELFFEHLPSAVLPPQDGIVFETLGLQWWMLPDNSGELHSYICKKGDTPIGVMNYPHVIEWNQDTMGPITEALRPAVTEENFIEALGGLRPSVTEAELKRYENLAETIGRT